MKIVFMGTPQAAVPSLERLVRDGHEIAAVYTQPDRPSGRGGKISFSPVKQFAIANGLAVAQPAKIKTSEAIDEFTGHNADVAVVVAYGRILPESFLHAFPNGAINVHFSLLPKYRGAAPVNWAIVNGETTTGITTMRMDAGLDTGDILLQREVGIGARENSIELMERLSVIGAELLAETLLNFGSLSPRRQDHENATLAPIMKKEDGLISWMVDAREIANRVRGFQPFPTTYLFLGGRKLTLWEAEPVVKNEVERTYAIGEVVEARGDTLLIACGGDSILSIGELQLEGKRRMPTRDFLNGSNLKPGEILGAA
jgi:methionyl-tRNA formyltransferase